MRTFVKLAASVAMAAAVPWIQVRVQCDREPFSEACVWGKAYLPLSTGVSIVLLAPLIFLVVWLVERRLRASGPRMTGLRIAGRKNPSDAKKG